MNKNKEGLARYLNIHLLALFAGLITFIVYLPALQNGFVSWDDNFYLYENSHIRHLNSTFLSWAFTEFYASNWHPLAWLSHAFDYAIWELDPWGHHLSNILLHSINTLLITVLSFRLLGRIVASGSSLISDNNSLLTIALITGLLFGLHPLHVESVAWISERKDLLCAFFYLLSLLLYLRFKRDSPTETKTTNAYRNLNYLLCLITFLLALMSKPMAISLPFILLLVDWLYSDHNKQQQLKNNLINKIPFFILALISAVITIAAQKSGHSLHSLEIVPLFDRLWVAAHALMAYLQKMVWPFDLLPYYAYPKSVAWNSPKYLIAALLVLLITTFTLLSIRNQKSWAAAWGYYLITLMPVLGIVKVGNQAMADRYTYLPSLAPFMLLAVGLVWGFRYLACHSKKSINHAIPPFVTVTALMGLLAALTQQQMLIWKNGETLWHYVIQYDDQIQLAYQQLGISLYERGEYAAAVETINKALNLNPTNAELLNNLAICHLELGNLDKATQTIHRALNLDPKNPFALNTLGEIYMAQQDYINANRSFSSAMQLEPDNPLRVFNLAVSFDKLNDATQACAYWRLYMELDVTGENDAEIIKHLSDLSCPLAN